VFFEGFCVVVFLSCVLGCGVVVVWFAIYDFTSFVVRIPYSHIAVGLSPYVDGRGAT